MPHTKATESTKEEHPGSALGVLLLAHHLSLLTAPAPLRALSSENYLRLPAYIAPPCRDNSGYQHPCTLKTTLFIPHRHPPKKKPKKSCQNVKIF